MFSSKVRTLVFSISVLTGVLALSLLTTAQTPANHPIARYTATTANVGAPGQAIRIELFAWSSDADRDQLVQAWTNPPLERVAPPPAAARGGGGGRGRGARGGAAAGDGQADAAAPAGANAGAAAAPVANPDDAQAAGARGGRGARGARGGGGGLPPAVVNAPPPKPLTPGVSVSQTLQKAPTVGMLWTSESAGYSIRYAYRTKQADGSERIIIATDRRLSPWNSLWKPTSGTSTETDYEFSIIELHMGAQGLGEGKASLASPVNVDAGTKSLALDNYTSLPIVLKNVKRQAVK